MAKTKEPKGKWETTSKNPWRKTQTHSQTGETRTSKKTFSGITYNPGGTTKSAGFSGISTGSRIGLKYSWSDWDKPKGKTSKEHPGGGLPYSSEDSVKGFGKDPEVVDGEIIEPKGLPRPPEDIIDAEVIEPKKPIGGGRRSLPAPKTGIEAPRQFQQIGNKSRLAIEGPKQSRGWLAGAELKTEELPKFAGTIYSGKVVDKVEGRPQVNSRTRPSNVFKRDPQAKAAFLNSPEVQSVQPNRITNTQFPQS